MNVYFLQQLFIHDNFMTGACHCKRFYFVSRKPIFIIELHSELKKLLYCEKLTRCGKIKKFHTVHNLTSHNFPTIYFKT